ncbi:MAG: phenylalanine--tRNA ligase subunit alpha, partial [Betaproteobacteria bacterium]|nr:phenylalanine--tRNA ligase subunit alpha [Betaproteobacteria bacterium]
MSLSTELENLIPSLQAELVRAFSLQELEQARVAYLGRKGSLARIMARLPELAPAERPIVGQKANEVKTRLTDLMEQRKAALEVIEEAKRLSSFDPSLPGRLPWQGSKHPTTLVVEEICGIFRGLGYEVASGPEVEADYYNFEALNMPPEHPARDMQDTLYITERVLMRTHTSPVQVRTMKNRKPPLAVIVPGKVYRRDSDLTHTPMFHQIEGLLVGKDVSMAGLRGTL